MVKMHNTISKKEKMKIQDLSLWEAFYWTAKDGSFTKAAKRLRIGTPFLSKKISRLEQELSVRLFFRSTRQLSLTSEGRVLLPAVESLLEDYRGLEERFQNQKEISGTIRLTCSSGLANRVLAPIIVDFCHKYPRIHFEVDASDRLVNLIEEQIDLAIRIQQPVESELIYKRLAANNLVLCASPEYLKRTKIPLKKIEDLHRHSLIMFKNYSNCLLQGTEFKLGDFERTKRVDGNSGTFLTQLALSGGGIAVRSIWDVRDFLEQGQLVPVLPNVQIKNPVDIYAVIPGRRLLSARVRTFLNFLEKEAKAWA